VRKICTHYNMGFLAFRDNEGIMRALSWNIYVIYGVDSGIIYKNIDLLDFIS